MHRQLLSYEPPSLSGPAAAFESTGGSNGRSPRQRLSRFGLAQDHESRTPAMPRVKKPPSVPIKASASIRRHFRCGSQNSPPPWSACSLAAKNRKTPPSAEDGGVGPNEWLRVHGTKMPKAVFIAECGSPLRPQPFDRDLELAVIEAGTLHPLVFPCRRDRLGRILRSR